MIDTVVNALRQRAAVAEYAVTEVKSRHAQRSAQRASSGDRHEVIAAVFYDDAAGRGDASLIVQPHQLADLSGLIDGAIERARRSRGPSWRLPSPAAPARVELFDDSFADDPAAGAFEIAQQIDKALAASGPLADAAGEFVRAPDASVKVDLISTEVRTSTGFRGVFPASRVLVSLTLSPVGEALEAGTSSLRLHRRRREDLAIEAALIDAAQRLRRRRRARRIDAGVYDLALPARAIEEAGPGFGWFEPLVAQADGAAARRGLARYLPGQPIFGDTDAGGDPLTIASDGTVAFAPLSLPFADHGAPVRRFNLVDKGVAAGLGLDLREAALANSAPNGGVRNLVIEPGSLRTDRAGITQNPLLTVSDLSHLHTDVHTGDFAAAVALGSLDGESVTGATLLGNVYSLLATARLSSEIAQRGWYHGPTEIRFASVQVV